MQYDELVLIRGCLIDIPKSVEDLVRLAIALEILDREIRLKELNPVTGEYKKPKVAE